MQATKQILVNLKVDQTKKEKFDKLCEMFGFSASSLFYIFFNKFIEEEGVPFEISAKKYNIEGSIKMKKYFEELHNLPSHKEFIKSLNFKNEEEADKHFFKIARDK
ncbi:hypothetical protein FACS189459_1520 [Bacilli bacterium]|nr:hypothetical protein FACS189459_1520 [Bacilli bacterium]